MYQVGTVQGRLDDLHEKYRLCMRSSHTIHVSGQIIATSHDFTPNGGLVEKSSISGKSGLVKYYNLTRCMVYLPMLTIKIQRFNVSEYTRQPWIRHGV